MPRQINVNNTNQRILINPTSNQVSIKPHTVVGGVSSVNGLTGAVVLNAASVGAASEASAVAAQASADAAQAAADAVVSIGSNANGDWIKFASGRMICSYYGIKVFPAYTAYGSLYINSFPVTFPQEFSSEPAISIGQIQWSTGGGWGSVWATTPTGFNARGYDILARASGSYPFSYIAVGRWAP